MDHSRNPNVQRRDVVQYSHALVARVGQLYRLHHVTARRRITKPMGGYHDVKRGVYCYFSPGKLVLQKKRKFPGLYKSSNIEAEAKCKKPMKPFRPNRFIGLDVEEPASSTPVQGETPKKRERPVPCKVKTPWTQKMFGGKLSDYHTFSKGPTGTLKGGALDIPMPEKSRCSYCQIKTRLELCYPCRRWLCVSCNSDKRVHNHSGCEQCLESTNTCPDCQDTFCPEHILHGCPTDMGPLVESRDSAKDEATRKDARLVKVILTDKQALEVQTRVDQAQHSLNSEASPALRKQVATRQLEQALEREEPPYDHGQLLVIARNVSYLQPKNITTLKAVKGALLQHLHKHGKYTDPDANRQLVVAVRAAMRITHEEVELSRALCSDLLFPGEEFVDRLRHNDRLNGNVQVSARIPIITKLTGLRFPLFRRAVPTNSPGQDPSSTVGSPGIITLIRLAFMSLLTGMCALFLTTASPAVKRRMQRTVGSTMLIGRSLGSTMNRVSEPNWLQSATGTAQLCRDVINFGTTEA